MAETVRAYQFDETEAELAFQAFAVLRKAAQAEPSLIDNPYFTALQDTAYARFLLNFEALS